MAVAARVLGGLIAFDGLLTILPEAQKTSDIFRYEVNSRNGDTASKKVARVAAEVFRLVGTVAFSMARIVMGLQMITMCPQLGFFGSVLSGARLAIPYIAGGVSALAVGALTLIHGESSVSGDPSGCQPHPGV